MVLRYNETTDEVVICAAWGPQTDWYRNLQAYPAATVQLGGQEFAPQQRFLTEEEAFDVAVGSAARIRIGSRCSTGSWAGETCDRTPRCGSSSAPIPSSRSSRPSRR
jgi:hypothetical protein